MLLEPLHGAADRRLRDAQLLGGQAEAAQPRDAEKGVQFDERSGAQFHRRDYIRASPAMFLSFAREALPA